MKRSWFVGLVLLVACTVFIPVGAGHNKVQGWMITRTAVGNVLSPILVEPEELNAPLGKYSCRATKLQVDAITKAHKAITGYTESLSPPVRRDGGGTQSGPGRKSGGGCSLGDPDCADCWTPICLTSPCTVPIDCQNACTTCWGTDLVEDPNQPVE
jgi:hypothetical protein